MLDLAGPEAQLCGKLLADMGADVIKVEPPGGDPARRMAPFAGDEPGPDTSLHFLYYNANKRSVVLDLESDAGLEDFKRLASSSQILIESFAPGYLEGLGIGYEELRRINPRLVMTSITSFGQTGAHRDYLGSDLVAQAMGGIMYVQGDDQRAPCAAPSIQAYQVASLHAAYGVLAALNEMREGGRGQHVDVSVQEVMAGILFSLATYASSGRVVRRTGVASPIAPSNYYRCKDGYAVLSVFMAHHWRTLVEWIGKDELADPMWEDFYFRLDNPDLIDPHVAEFVGQFTVEELLEEANKRHISAMRFNDTKAYAESVQVKARNSLIESHHPRIGKHRYPVSGCKFGETPWQLARPAPILGEHQDEVLQGLAPISPEESLQAGSAPPLEGIRIIDFSRVWAGPMATRYLGDMGAEIIKIETERYLDQGRSPTAVDPLFPEVNRSKLGITLDFQKREGRELVEELAKVSDVVIDNYSPGVLARRGLGYERLRMIRPDIIMISMPAYGNYGPYAGMVAYGHQLMAYTGLSYLWGHPESPYEARPKVHYPDFVSAPTAAFAITAALEYRSRTGRGQYIELAQAEGLAAFMGVPLLDWEVNGRSWKPMGSRNRNAAPRGCYPCAGEDRWCVIDCWTEEQWEGLRRAMGHPDWAMDARFSELEVRLENQVELDEHVGRWTEGFSPDEVMEMLQREGVPAGVVQSGEQMYYDRHLRARGFLVELEHPKWGRTEHAGRPIRLSNSSGPIRRPVPALGQHNEYVYRDLLGVAPADLDQLVQDKVVN